MKTGYTGYYFNTNIYSMNLVIDLAPTAYMLDPSHNTILLKLRLQINGVNFVKKIN